MMKLLVLVFAFLTVLLTLSCEHSKDLRYSDVKTNESYSKNTPLKQERLLFECESTAPPPPPPNKKDVRSTFLNTEEYDKIVENTFKSVSQQAISTFSIDVDHASYSNVRRFINQNVLPPKSAVRIEEMVNYFNYDYPQPKNAYPFSINTEIAQAPWNSQHHLVHIGLQGKSLDYATKSPTNLVFLVDASGSMRSNNKLPLLKNGLKVLLDQLDKNDKVAIVAYAGAAGLVLPSTAISNKQEIVKALEGIESGGSTAGGQGIELAYKIAQNNLIENGNNRVILATDGDFNLGVSSTGSLVELIKEKRKDNIYLTICGLGMGNYKDGRMEQISNAGNGNYFYIDNMLEAEKVFSKEMHANLFTIAKDVKIQIEFNPNTIKAYRLIGYENRMLVKEDFDNDAIDAGELGAGHTVTAIYEVILVGSVSEQTVHQTMPLKYQKVIQDNSDDLMTVKFRYKKPEGAKSILIEQVLGKQSIPALSATSDNFRFSAAVAGVGMLLRDSEYKSSCSYKTMIDLANASKGADNNGYRSEFIQLIKKAALLARNTHETEKSN
jgi:Ca-activated chloride channel family protein